MPAMAPPEIEESLLVTGSVSGPEVEVGAPVEVTVTVSSSVGVAVADVSVGLCEMRVAS